MHVIDVLHDPRLRAHVVRRIPLGYREGADPGLDRPAHIRAASALAWIGERLAVVQDDANFIALLDPRAEGGVAAESLTLPAGPHGRRQFDDGRGNKAAKLDLESCVSFSDGAVTTLLAFGSGSTPARERILRVRFVPGRPPGVEVMSVPDVYASLRAATDFSGTELNIEGALLRSATELRLFGRGNGASRDGGAPVNAICSLDWGALRDRLDDRRRPAPRPHAIAQYDLGSVDGVPLGFTDAIAWGGAMLYSAAAEASLDAVRDGTVAGSAIGVIGPDGSARYAVLLDEDGQPFPGKLEGLAEGPDPGAVYGVADEDDPMKASELCTIRLEGRWR